MSELKYKIMSYPTAYSKKKGSYTKRICVAKDLTLEEALSISHKKNGNTNKAMEWRTSGLIYPTEWKIKR
jgi:hypothetical protein